MVACKGAHRCAHINVQETACRDTDRGAHVVACRGDHRCAHRVAHMGAHRAP